MLLVKSSEKGKKENKKRNYRMEETKSKRAYVVDEELKDHVC